MNFIKPEKKHVYVDRYEGKFNLLSSDTLVKYMFRFPELTRDQIEEMGLTDFYVLKPEEDYGWEDYSGLDCAYEIKSVVDGYWINTSKKDIDKLLEYLESIEEEQELLRKEYDIEYAKAKIDYWSKKLERLNM